MDDEEQFQKEIKLMEKKINSIKTDIDYLKITHKHKKQRKILTITEQLSNNNNNLFKRKYSNYQTTPNTTLTNRHEYKSLIVNTSENEKPLTLKRDTNKHDHYMKTIDNKSNNRKEYSNDVFSLRKKFLSKERFKSFDNTNYHDNKYKGMTNNVLVNYNPASLSNRSIHKNKVKRNISNANVNNTNYNYNDNSNSIIDSIEKRVNTTNSINYSRNERRGNRYNSLYAYTQECLTPRNDVNRTEYHSRENINKERMLYNEIMKLSKEQCAYISYDECENEVITDEERILNEFKRLLKDNKNKNDLINKAIDLYETNTGHKLNYNMNIEEILFEWIRELASVNKTNYEDDKYKNFCEGIMYKYNLQNFDEFKCLVSNALTMVNRKSNFVEGIKKLLLTENTYNTYQHKNNY